MGGRGEGGDDFIFRSAVGKALFAWAGAGTSTIKTNRQTPANKIMDPQTSNCWVIRSTL